MHMRIPYLDIISTQPSSQRTQALENVSKENLSQLAWSGTIVARTVLCPQAAVATLVCSRKERSGSCNEQAPGELYLKQKLE